MLGLVIEKVSGKRLSEHLKETVWDKVGMPDTTFEPSPAQRERLARPLPLDPLTGKPQRILSLDTQPKFDCGGACAFGTMGDYLRFNSAIGNTLSELVILITARAWSQSYEWSAHQPIALKAGLSQSVIDQLKQKKRPEGMKEDEAIVYDLCTELDDNKVISDDTFNRAKRIDLGGVSLATTWAQKYVPIECPSNTALACRKRKKANFSHSQQQVEVF